ncbi:MAG: flagellar hook-length control protein FliK, partial [Thauera sp.]|nr:flagellar hook-length control protein FliK [Thauera sp.]
AAGTTAETASRATEAAASRSAADTEANRSASTTARAALDETAAPRPGAIPERLMPVVHQQLDALATQQYVWQGQAWPGQNFEWWIEDPQHEGEHAGEEPENTWNTTLRLTLPRLGGVEARLHLTPAGVALRLVADDRATLQTLDGGAAALASALEAANLKLTGLVIEPRAVAPNREVASDA